MHLSVRTAAELLALRSVDSLVEGAAVCVLSYVMLRIIPRQNAASRFAVWFAALISIAIGPILGGLWSPSTGMTTRYAHAVLQVPQSWAIYFFVGWAAIAMWLLLQVAGSISRLYLLRRSCVAVDAASLAPIIQETLRKHGANRKVKLCTSRDVTVPAAIGFWNPVVVVPAWAMRELTPDELNQVVLHELAHLRRWDDWTNLAQQVVKALFFFHPAVWWIEKKASLEREIACDDAVLAETARPRAYAECLAHLAEKSLAHRSLALAHAALGKVRQFSARVAEIVDANRPAPTCTAWRPAIVVVLTVVVGCAAWNARTPRLIAFESHEALPAAPVLAASAHLPETAAAPMWITPTPVRLTDRPHRRAVVKNQRPTALAAKAPNPPERNMVHLAGGKLAPVPSTETVWIVVQRSQSIANQQVLQIEMWRVTVLRTPATATPQIPRKI